jgi:hypothetical protein
MLFPRKKEIPDAILQMGPAPTEKSIFVADPNQNLD